MLASSQNANLYGEVTNIEQKGSLEEVILRMGF